MLQDREGMKVPEIKFHWCEAVASPKLIQVLLTVGDDDNDRNLRFGTGSTIIEALERFVEHMKFRAVLDDDQRMRKILGAQ